MAPGFLKKLGVKKAFKKARRFVTKNPEFKAVGRILSRTANATAQGVADRFGMGAVYKQTRKSIVGGVKARAKGRKR